MRGEAPDTALTRQRYDRIAPLYDALEWGMERMFRRWRRQLWARAPTGRLLEVGVGTGKNLPFYPPGAEVTAIDLSAGMLARAQRRASRLGVSASLAVADVQALPYADASFDAAVATCVFCSVPDPVRGLQELRRVLRPGGRLFLLEHVRSRRPWLGRMMTWFDPLPFRLWGAHIDRDTLDNLVRAGFRLRSVQPRWGDVVLQIEAD